MLKTGLAILGKKYARLCAASLSAIWLLAIGVSTTQTAVANGDTRTITFVHEHTGETTTVTFRVNGSYDSAALKKLNWALRDWRRDEPTEMDPRLFDVLWEVYRELGIHEVHVVSAYRSPETNAMLRRRSRAVAKHSQHMLGKAMDTFVPGVAMSKVREIGLRLQRGGVGYYPTANTPFVHLDVGSVRMWPRMSYEQLSRIFPDGKTVHIPSNGVPLAHYEEARAEIERSGGTAYAASTVSGGGRGFFASLFGGGEDEDDSGASTGRRGRTRVAALDRGSAGSSPSGQSSTNSRNGDMYAFMAPPAAPAVARVDIPLRGRGRAVAVEVPPPAPIVVAQAVPVAAPPPAKPQVLAEPEAVKPDPVKPEAVKPGKALDIAVLTPDGTAVDKARIVPMPAPPRRPANLPVNEPQLAFAKVPLPPQRPVEFAALSPRAPARQIEADLPEPVVQADASGDATSSADKAALSRNIAALSSVPVPPPPLPRVITDGGLRAIQANVLAFAAHTGTEPVVRSLVSAMVPVPPKRPDFFAARLDRSNFRSLTAPLPSAKAQHSASVVQPMRASIKTDTFAYMTLPESGVASSFGAAPNGDLRADAFTGPAIRPFATAGVFVELPTGSIDKQAQ